MVQVFFLDDDYARAQDEAGRGPFSPEKARLDMHRVERCERALTREEQVLIEMTIQSTLAGVLFLHPEQEPIDVAVTQDPFHEDGVKGIPLLGSTFLLNIDPTEFRKTQTEILKKIPDVCLTTLFGAGGLAPLHAEKIQTACKPGSVPAKAVDDHSSTAQVALSL